MSSSRPQPGGDIPPDREGGGPTRQLLRVRQRLAGVLLPVSVGVDAHPHQGVRLLLGVEELPPGRARLDRDEQDAALRNRRVDRGAERPEVGPHLLRGAAEMLIDLLLAGEINAAMVGDVQAIPARIDDWSLFEERYVAAADPALQTDVLPDREPLTHLPSPWA